MSGYEKRDVRIAPVMWFMGGLLVIFTVSLWAMARVDEALRPTSGPAHPLATERVVPPAPRLEVVPGVLLEETERNAAVELESYGWIDAETDHIRVPIDRAMELALEEGFPTR